MSEHVDGGLGPVQRRSLVLHLVMCGRCRRVLENLTTIVRTLRSPGFAARDAVAENDSEATRMTERWRRTAE